MSEFLGIGLVTAVGEVHKRQRTIINPTFRVSRINALIPTFIQSANELKSSWMSKLDGSNELIIKDACEELGKPTLDVIGRAGFNFDFNACLGGDVNVNSLFAAFNVAVKSFGMPDILIRMLFPTLRYIIPGLIQTRLEYERALVTIKESCSTILENRKRELVENPNAEGTDLLSDVLRANLLEDENTRLTDDEVMSQCMTFLAAGQETTTVALTWALYFISKNKHVQDSLRGELQHQMPSPSQDPSPEYISSTTTYLEAVANESLRLLPPVPWLIRIAAQDDELDGYFVPKGTKVYVSPHLLHRMTEYWGDDALEFNPSRWIKSENSKDDAEQILRPFCAFFPFSTGPRYVFNA
ncbi:UNVERIFIED_CONTAM: hypothetical protein HDU68_009062 [Siphonaria sp. JEL0065]|nr:hypothetical protein HDU68_009062 [Siphonaria sp. JEL0065]